MPWCDPRQTAARCGSRDMRRLRENLPRHVIPTVVGGENESVVRAAYFPPKQSFHPNQRAGRGPRLGWGTRTLGASQGWGTRLDAHIPEGRCGSPGRRSTHDDEAVMNGAPGGLLPTQAKLPPQPASWPGTPAWMGHPNIGGKSRVGHPAGRPHPRGEMWITRQTIPLMTMKPS